MHFGQAIADHTRAIELCPGGCDLWFTRAVTFYRAGEIRQAQADVEQCRKLGGRIPESFQQALAKATRPTGRGE